MKKASLFIAAVVALSFSGSFVHAADGKSTGQFGWFGVGKAYEIEKDHYYWVGEFSGTFFNDKGEGSPMHNAGVKCPGQLDLNYATDKSTASGYCMIQDLDGDKIHCVWRNEGVAKPGNFNPGTFECKGQSGKYKGLDAKNTFKASTRVNWADGTSSGVAIWNR